MPTAPVLTSIDGTAVAVVLFWDSPTSDGGAPITLYQVYRGTSPSSLESVGTDGAGPGLLNSYLDGPVPAGLTYYYAVAATNSRGTGPKSDVLSTTGV